MEMQFGVYLAGFQSCVVQYFLTSLPFLLFGMAMCIHCMLEVCDLLPDFNFQGIAVKRLLLVSEKTELLNTFVVIFYL